MMQIPTASLTGPTAATIEELRRWCRHRPQATMLVVTAADGEAVANSGQMRTVFATLLGLAGDDRDRPLTVAEANRVLAEYRIPPLVADEGRANPGFVVPADERECPLPPQGRG